MLKSRVCRNAFNGQAFPETALRSAPPSIRWSQRNGGKSKDFTISHFQLVPAVFLMIKKRSLSSSKFCLSGWETNSLMSWTNGLNACGLSSLKISVYFKASFQLVQSLLNCLSHQPRNPPIFQRFALFSIREFETPKSHKLKKHLPKHKLDDWPSGSPKSRPPKGLILEPSVRKFFCKLGLPHKELGRSSEIRFIHQYFKKLGPER